MHREREEDVFGLRGQELIIVLVVVLVLFGGKKLPELARSLGASAREFRKGIDSDSDAGDESGTGDRPDTPKS